MKLKNKLILLGVSIGVISCFGIKSSQASEITSVFSGKTITRNTVQNVELASENNTSLVPVTLGISKDRESGNWYVWNPLTTALDENGKLKEDDKGNVQAQKVWKIAKYSSESSATRDYSNLYYCLNPERGFGLTNGEMAEGAKDVYSTTFNMKDYTQKTTITSLSGGKLGENYNKILWILDNSYIPTNSSNYQKSLEYKKLMNAAGIEVDADERLNLTEDDIEVVQQMTIWYFTNSESANYKNDNLPSLYLNGTQLSSIYLYTTEYGEQITGAERQEKAKKLYNYFITKADQNYTVKTPTLTLSNTNVTVTEDGNNYIVGPFSLSGTNTDLIKEISATLNVNATLLDSSKKEVANNYFSKVIGDNFYLRITKNNITSNKEITIELTYTYDERNLTLLTDRNDPTNTQPVVLVESSEKSLSTNTKANIELTSISVEKVWDDKDNQDGKRPNSVKVQLYKNNEKYGNSITLSSTNNWTYNWDKLLDGYTYSVKELNKSEVKVENNQKYDNNYTATYEIETSGNKTTITNTYTPETTEVSITKIWQDNNNQDGKRPNKITINLLADEEKILSKEVTSENNWTYTFDDLPKYKNGKEIIYRITEDAIADYSSIINGYNITNKYTPQKVNKTVIKRWEDGNNADKIRPEEITVKLYKLVDNEEVTIDTVNLDARNNWTYTWENLDEKSNGNKIIYGIKEIDSLEGYTTTYDAENYANTDTITITNTHVSKELAIQIQKVDENENIITSSEATFEISGKQNVTETTTQGILDLNSQQLSKSFEFIYTIKETKAPIGYTGITNDLSVKIIGTTKIEDSSYAIDTINITDKEENQLDTTKILAEYDEELNKVIIKIVNKKIENAYSVKLLKVSEDGVTPIEDAWFKINDNKAIQISKEGNEIETGILGNNNELTLKYKLEETIAPSGYIKIDGQKEIEIKAKIELKDNKYEITEVKLVNNIEGITISEENNVIILKVANKPEVITGKYNVLLKKVDEKGNILKGAKFEIDGTEYDLTDGEKIILENEQLTSTDSVTKTYNIKETVVPEGYEKLEDTEVIINATVVKDEKAKAFKILRVTGTFDGENTHENVTVTLDGNTIVIIVKNIPIQKKLDLALRKFITKINDETYSREPIVDTSKLRTTVDGKVITTATYKHIKQPIAVQKGDVVTYTIRVYNEGEIDGYVDKITDHLPDNLLPIIEGIEGIDSEKYKDEIEFNSKYSWTYIDKGNTITTTATSKNNSEIYSVMTGLEEITDTKLDAYVDGSDELDYIDVQIKCLVTDNTIGDEYITNIAEITDAQDINGVHTDGADSELSNVDYSNLSDYKNEEALKSTTDSYVPGQEDDDDFEKLVVKEFDLCLRKFITKVNETTHSREPKVDTSKLGTTVEGKVITTATYTHSKEPVIVETNDIVTYKIRVYNEGTIAGYANEITDNIPQGLEFLPNSDVNVSYRWKMIDKDGNETEDLTKAVMITTDYLSDRDRNNIIKEVTESNGVKTLSYKDVEVQFKVVAKPEKLKDNIIINEAQISADSDRDIDSIPNKDENYDYTTEKNEDDIDYEPIKLQYFDLALRKFITKVNTMDYNNRYPEVKFNDDGSITYKHTKDPVLVETGDTVIYTIRVYNEGEKAGYATEIKDNLPDGLAFDPNNETNKLYAWKMIDKDGNVTEDANKVVAFTTNYLEKEIIDSLVNVNGSKMLSYKDVQIAFTVTGSNKSDKILVNTAEISADSDDDIDSTPNNNLESEDDIDKEYVKVEYFDLSLKKWITETIVTLDGKTTTTKTGLTQDSEGIAKVDIVASKIKKTTVKFKYSIKVTNEGELPGYAYEVKDYIPSGLKFVADDNKNWKEVKDNMVVTDQLKDTLLNPGESATVEIVLTWKNSSTNFGLKTNYAEISEDSGDDIDSTPDNYDFTEDDMDDAQILLSIKTANKTTYIGLILISIIVLAGGIYGIKKYVLK